MGFGPVWAEEPAGEPVAGEKPATPTALTTPLMTGPLAGNPNPINFDAGPLGPVYMTSVVSGLGLWQNNPFSGDQRSLASLSNGQFIFQKTDGLFQYYVQAGADTTQIGVARFVAYRGDHMGAARGLCGSFLSAAIEAAVEPEPRFEELVAATAVRHYRDLPKAGVLTMRSISATVTP